MATVGKYKGKNKKKFSVGQIIIAVILIAIILVAVGFGGYYLYNYAVKPRPTVVSEDLSIHFLELGNASSGDCIYIKAGENDILVDAGSRVNSVPTISNYLKNYVTDDKLEFVIVTHAHRDHIAGFTGNNNIFDRYKTDYIIDYPMSESTAKIADDYKTNVAKEVADGAKNYNALQCYNNADGAQSKYNLGKGITLTILYQEFYENDASCENDYSVCFLLTQGERNFLFTGDLESKGESSLVEYNDLPQVDVFKAGHHGSDTSNSVELLNVIKPKIICVSAVAGSVEYTQTLSNTFPKQSFIDTVAEYTDRIFVTSYCAVEYNGTKYSDGENSSLNGNIVINSGAELKVVCSKDNSPLKDTTWFKNNRTLPQNWKSGFVG